MQTQFFAASLAALTLLVTSASAAPGGVCTDGREAPTADRSATPLDRTLGPRSPVSPPADPFAARWNSLGWGLDHSRTLGFSLGMSFGMKALGDASSPHCTGENVCDHNPMGDLKSSMASSGGVVAGGLLLGAGVGMLTLLPRVPSWARARGLEWIRVVPVLGATSAGAVVKASF